MHFIKSKLLEKCVNAEYFYIPCVVSIPSVAQKDAIDLYSNLYIKPRRPTRVTG